MGGFHGGHSSGSHGGFHGGGHSSHSSHHYRSTSYHSTRIYHSSGHGFYFGGQRGRKATLLTKYLIFGILSIMFGILILVALMDVAVDAKITNTSIIGSGYDKYEIYGFEYKFNNKTYYGHGDDDLSSTGELTIEEGQTYTLYVNPFIPTKYKFDSDASAAIVMFLIFAAGGTTLIVIGIINYKRYKAELEKVGDINKDGVVDEKDLEYADKIAKGKAEGAYEGTKAATAENTYQEKKIYRRCPYCDSIVDDNAKFCPNCGSNLNNK